MLLTSHPIVIKVHFTPIVARRHAWVFATTRLNGSSALALREKLSQKIGYPLRLLHTKDDLVVRGYAAIASECAATFSLPDKKTLELIEFLRSWEVLRRV